MQCVIFRQSNMKLPLCIWKNESKYCESLAQYVIFLSDHHKNVQQLHTERSNGWQYAAICNCSSLKRIFGRWFDLDIIWKQPNKFKIARKCLNSSPFLVCRHDGYAVCGSQQQRQRSVSVCVEFSRDLCFWPDIMVLLRPHTA